METVTELKKKLSLPSRDLIKDISELKGDIMILGIGGKMGPTLGRLAKNAVKKAKIDKKIIGVSRFSREEVRKELESAGIKTIKTDLFQKESIDKLPDVKNIIYMVGQKFGTTGREHLTWAINTYLPAKVAEYYKNSRILFFSTGNVYPLTPVKSGGSTEITKPDPVGEYAQSCLGRERIFEYFSRKYEIPVLAFRLNYAIDLRYGVLLDIAQSVKNRETIDLSMGHVNVIWQKDAAEIALRALSLCNTPPEILNVTGPEIVSVRWLAEWFGSYFDIEPIFENEEKKTALLSNAGKANQIFGYPEVSLLQMLEWTAGWVEKGNPTFDKPTKFGVRKGQF
ncbi:MAG: NAD-dependent epimerase/dehydratase family protein [Halanaerobiaceae bacterium]